MCIPESKCTKDSDCTSIAKKQSSSFGACVFKGEFPSECNDNDCFWVSECPKDVGNSKDIKRRIWWNTEFMWCYLMI